MATNVASSPSITAAERINQASGSGSANPVRISTAGFEAEQRATQNGQILEASLQVSLQSGNNSQALLFRAAIAKINELLAPTQGPDALQNALGEDNSAEGTAARILSLSTAFFDSYAAQSPDKDPETLVRNFVDVIRGGFERGYQEAADILQGLGVLNGEVASGIERTYALVQQGLDDFLAARLESLQAQRTA